MPAKKTKLLNLDKFINKIHTIKKQNKLDLSSDQDLSIALMNLISLEEHFYFSGVKTEDHKYYTLLKEVREIRKSLFKKIVKAEDDGSEVWCISKHLLAASMRLMEVGTKQLDQGNQDYAYELFKQAYDLYSLFWGINLGLIEKEEERILLASLESAKTSKDEISVNITNNNDTKFSWRTKLGNIVRKLINCCLE